MQIYINGNGLSNKHKTYNVCHLCSESKQITWLTMTLATASQPCMVCVLSRYRSSLSGKQEVLLGIRYPGKFLSGSPDDKAHFLDMGRQDNDDESCKFGVCLCVFKMLSPMLKGSLTHEITKFFYLLFYRKYIYNLRK